MKKSLVIYTAILVLTACGSTDNKVVNYEAQGNLSHSQSMQCVEISEVSNKNNPVDIFIGLSQCIENNNYNTAAQLYFVGMSYGYFDTKRVSDKTAHQAVSVLRMNVFGSLPQDKLESFQAALELVSTDAVCPSIVKLGPPEYMPTYMIQHGMGAFTGQATKDGLVEDFNAVSAWSDSLLTVAKCDVES